MYKELITELMSVMLTSKIINIYTSDEKVGIGIGGVNKSDVELGAFYLKIKKTNKTIWYAYNDIKKIEVY